MGSATRQVYSFVRIENDCLIHVHKRMDAAILEVETIGHRGNLTRDRMKITDYYSYSLRSHMNEA